MAITVKIDQVGPFFNAGSERRFPAAVAEALDFAGTRISAELSKASPKGVSSPGLANSWVHQVKDLSVSVTNTQAHLEPVDLGRRPAYVPIAPLELWVREKIGIEGPQARRVAFAISRTMAARPTPGKEFVNATMQQVFPQIWVALKFRIPAHILACFEGR
jgi:hypothetical protein